MKPMFMKLMQLLWLLVMQGPTFGAMMISGQGSSPCLEVTGVAYCTGWNIWGRRSSRAESADIAEA
jgi:hypothetical protein